MEPRPFPESEGWKALKREIEGIAEVRGEARGRVEGEQQALLSVLAARGLVVDAATRAHIEACHDLPTLTRWITRAVAAVAIEHVFSVEGDAE